MRFYRNRSIRWPEILASLRQLLRHLRGNMVLIWDRGKPHRAKKLSVFLKKHRHRLTVEWFPPYSPDLNPVEHVWGYVKQHRLANHGLEDVKVLHRRVWQEAKRTGNRQDLLRSFIQASELPWKKY